MILLSYQSEISFTKITPGFLLVSWFLRFLQIHLVMYIYTSIHIFAHEVHYLSWLVLIYRYTF